MPTATKSNPLQAAARKMKVRAEPVWIGPESDGPQGGVTQGLIGRYLCCPERFRLMVIEGLKPADRFNKSIEYGNLWHACEEAHALTNGVNVVNGWSAVLEKYAKGLFLKYPMDRAEVDRWYNCCRVQFPEYVRYWSEHPDVTEREPVFAEREFRVPHRLPSGRTVFLRGKWDSVDIVKTGENAGLWLQENKTKGRVLEQQLQRQVTYDLQTMTYIVALQEYLMVGENGKTTPMSRYRQKMLRGVRYNVIRRPLASGNRGTITQGKGTKGAKCPKCKGEPGLPCQRCSGDGRINARPPETDEEFYGRLRSIIDGSAYREDPEQPGPDYFFMRWNILVSQADIDRFRRQTLDPVLENLCDDFEWWAWCKRDKGPDPFEQRALRHSIFPGHWPRHWRMPFGVYNPLTEGNPTDLDNFLAAGDRTGLQVAADLFPELSKG